MTQQRPPLATAAQPPAPEKKQMTVGAYLMQEANIKRIASVVPKHMTAERMLRVAAHAVAKTKNLDQVPIQELLGGIMVLSSLGLEPNTVLGHAYLIPFAKNTKVGDRWESTYTLQIIIGYRGYVELMRRSGAVVSIHADVVYEGDDFSYEYGSNQHLRHLPKGDNAGRKPKYAYCYVKLKDGEAFEVLPYERVLTIRNSAQAYQQALRKKGEADAEKDPKRKKRAMESYESAPWVKHEHEMAAKTMVRRIAKYVPLSIELQNTLELESATDQAKAVNYANLVDVDFSSPLDLGAEDVQEIEHNPGEQVAETGGKTETKEKVEVKEEKKDAPAPKTKAEPKKTAAPAEEKKASQPAGDPRPEPEEEAESGPSFSLV